MATICGRLHRQMDRISTNRIPTSRLHHRDHSQKAVDAFLGLPLLPEAKPPRDLPCSRRASLQRPVQRLRLMPRRTHPGIPSLIWMDRRDHSVGCADLGPLISFLIRPSCKPDSKRVQPLCPISARWRLLYETTMYDIDMHDSKLKRTDRDGYVPIRRMFHFKVYLLLRCRILHRRRQ